MPSELLGRVLASILQCEDDDPCICDSGKPFKDCHKPKLAKVDRDPNAVMHEIITIRKKKECLFASASSCAGEIISAHSVSRRFLKQIAEDGHVYAHVKRKAIEKLEAVKHGQYPNPGRIGIGQASTFPGLCEGHDNGLFTCFEDHAFVASDDQIAALHLRAVLKELHVKHEATLSISALSSITRQTSRSDVVPLRHVQQTISQMGHNLALRDQYAEFARIRNLVLRKPTPVFHHLVFRMQGECPLLTSTIANPAFDANCHLIQDYSDEEYVTSSFAFSVVCEPNEYFYVFSWFESQPIDEFFKVLAARYQGKSILQILIQMSFAYSENSYFRIRWFDGLKPIHRNRLNKLFWSEFQREDAGQYTALEFRHNIQLVPDRIACIKTDTGLQFTP